MLFFDDILQQVEREIELLEFNYPPKSLYDPIEYILALGGKRIRPALTLMACNLFQNDVRLALKPALGLEVFHNFTLLHDDLMDKADVRRKKPTVHKLWNENAAILSGDTMLIAAYQLIGNTDPAYLKKVLDLFTVTALEICGGQQYDMEFESRENVSEYEYLEMIRLKTAVLLACCLKTGAILGGADDPDADYLYQFGINMGLAFQLRDDLLDVYGDPETFGKNIGGDILCNKKTFLLISALQLCSDEQKHMLQEWMTRTVYNPEQKISLFSDMYNLLGVKELTEKKIQEFYDKGMNCLSSLSVGEEKLVVLKSVAENLMQRQS